MKEGCVFRIGASSGSTWMAGVSLALVCCAAGCTPGHGDPCTLDPRPIEIPVGCPNGGAVVESDSAAGSSNGVRNTSEADQGIPLLNDAIDSTPLGSEGSAGSSSDPNAGAGEAGGSVPVDSADAGALPNSDASVADAGIAADSGAAFDAGPISDAGLQPDTGQ